MKNMFHIVSAYVSADYELTPDGLCIVKIRGEETKYIPIDTVMENFNKSPFVNGCGGIMHAYIFNTETRVSNYIYKK